MLDGVQFLDREEFRHPDCRAWKVIGTADFAPVDDRRVVIRTERWRVPPGATRTARARWPEVRQEAAARGLAALETAPSMEATLAGPGWERTMDLTQFVLTIWFPDTRVGDGGPPSLWPNSPPLPEPGPDDGVCEPSRGEDQRVGPRRLYVALR